MKKESPVQLELLFPQDIKSEKNIMIMFLTIENLEKNILNIKNNNDFMATDILIFIEALTKQSKNVHINSYDQKLIQNSSQKKGGYIIYTKSKISENVFNSSEIKYGRNSYIFDLITNKTAYIIFHHDNNDNIIEFENKITRVHEKIKRLNERGHNRSPKC